MGSLRIAVHQPNYLPWLGFFHKIRNVDIFVLLDTVQFARRGYSHRVRVMGPNGGALLLTQHIRKQPVEEQFIHQLEFSDKHWVDKHLKTMNAAYRRTPYFNEVFSLIENSISPDTNRLAELNWRMIQCICNALGIQTKIVKASQFDLGPFSSPSERIACIVHHLGGRFYLSGAGARAYNDTAVFDRYGIELGYDDFTIDPYPQRGHQFIGGLSVVDALFNVGYNGVSAILERRR